MNKFTIAAATALTLTFASGAFAANEVTQAPMMLAATVSGTADKAEVAGSDTWITTKVKANLMTEKGIPGSDIVVETNQGVVSLSGSVTKAQKATAVAIAKKTKHVKSVSADGLKTVD